MLIPLQGHVFLWRVVANSLLIYNTIILALSFIMGHPETPPGALSLIQRALFGNVTDENVLWISLLPVNKNEDRSLT